MLSVRSESQLHDNLPVMGREDNNKRAKIMKKNESEGFEIYEKDTRKGGGNRHPK